MDFKRIIHKPDYFGCKSSDDSEGFIEAFEIVKIQRITEKTIILPLYLTVSTESFVNILKIRNQNVAWKILKGQLIEKFTLIKNKSLLRAQLI